MLVAKEKFVLPKEYEVEMRRSEYSFRDSVYNAMLTAHAKRGKPWTTSGFFNDRLFWNFLLDEVWAWVPSLLFIYVMYFVASWTYDHYGVYRAVILIAVMMAFRLNVLIRQVTFTNKLLKGQR